MVRVSRKSLSPALPLALLAMLVGACADDPLSPPPTGALAGQVLVLNSGTGTNSLSLCDATSLEVRRDVAPSALYPNHALQVGERLFVTCSGDDRIVEYGMGDSSLVAVATWSLNELDSLHDGELVYTPWASVAWQGELYTSFSARDRIGAIPLTGDSLREFTTGIWPQDLKVAGDTLFVACAGFSLQTLAFGMGEVRAHHLPDGRELWRATVAANPQRLDFGPEGQLLVLSTGDYGLREGVLTVLDRTGGTVGWTLPLGDFPGSLAVDGHKVWLAAWGQYDLQPGGSEGRVTRIDLDTRAFDRGPDNPWRVQAGATDLCVAEGRLFVSCFAQDALCVIQGDSLLECLAVGHGPGALRLLQ